jgi:hypothetical protein
LQNAFLFSVEKSSLSQVVESISAEISSIEISGLGGNDARKATERVP